ncbi:hypothetical protein HPB50_007295 [Hyalomma asiaticum]|uniref:Uncharacterized protein n=1 Tax=Hyalomma asiaticum TaxID=266040 RepID=A0ACB7RM79_HYAAI|nr:hypothetical protein HPB50_007295 [Hyalomma asiaticum]
MDECSFAWPLPDGGASEAQLEDVNLEIKPGSLVGVVGFVGSGKSSLLAAMLGDMHVIEGKVTCTGRTAFAPQLPVLHNMTVRDNILYGREMDTAFYQRVIQCCQLTNDINSMAAADMSEVGEKGSNLSGGQKQRISIARAVYSNSDVYLLDDPLSALDPVVASRVFRDVIGKKGLLKHKTRIMVCNQGKYLHHMDNLILVDKKRIKVYDKLEDLINDPKSPQNFREALQDQTAQLLTKNECEKPGQYTRLTHGNGQYGIKDQVVNVPIEVPKLVQCLPHNVPEDAAIDVHIKRRLVNKASYKCGLVKRSNIHACLKHIDTTPPYKHVNMKIDWSRLTQFDGDEAECDDDEIERLPEITDLDGPVQAVIALNAVSRTLVYGVSNNVHAMNYSDRIEDNDVDGRLTQDELGKSSKTGWQLLCKLLCLTRWPAVTGVVAFMGAACAFGAQQVWIKWGTDSAAGGVTTSSPSGQQQWVEILVLLCLTDVLLRAAGSVLLAMSARRLSRSLHSDMLSHVLQSPVTFFDESPRGRILNRLSTDIDYVDARTFLSGKQCVQNTLLTLAKIAVVGTQTPSVVGVTAVVALLVCYGLFAAVQASHICRYVESLAMSRLLQHVTETVDALSSVRTYGAVDRFARHFYRLTDAMMRGYACFGANYGFVRTLTSATGFIVVICTLLTTVVFAGPDGPDPASVGLALSAACSIPLSLMSLCIMLFNVLQMIVSFERCVEYTELPPEIDVPASESESDAPPNVLPSVWPSSGMIEFQNYSASYRPGVHPDVLKDVTFVVKPMEKIGVVGRTGAGKSSLVLALLRMLRPSKGRILIDGVDIANVPLRKIRRSITVIPQDPSLVRGTLRTNLDPTNSHSDEDIWQALQRSHLSKVVSSDPKGLLLETTDGGTNLSVGQRQLVCLARALLRQSKILLLDEATSQMDGDTDRLIQETLRDAFANCTLLTVAHRIHTVLDYDRILVLQEGRVREFDSVATLLSDTSSAFYSMAVEAGISIPTRTADLISADL